MSNRWGGIDGDDEALRPWVSDVRTEDLDGHLPHPKTEKMALMRISNLEDLRPHVLGSLKIKEEKHKHFCGPAC